MNDTLCGAFKDAFHIHCSHKQIIFHAWHKQALQSQAGTCHIHCSHKQSLQARATEELQSTPSENHRVDQRTSANTKLIQRPPLRRTIKIRYPNHGRSKSWSDRRSNSSLETISTGVDFVYNGSVFSRSSLFFRSCYKPTSARDGKGASEI